MKRKRHQLTAADIVKAMKRLADSDLWYIPVTAGEAKGMHELGYAAGEG